MRTTRTSTIVTLQSLPEEEDLEVRKREVEMLRIEFRRVSGRINYRKRRGYMFIGFLVLTLAIVLSVGILMLSPTDWAISQQSRFTQMTALIMLVLLATPTAGYFARRYDRQRERVRVARTRQQEILQRLEQLDTILGVSRRRRRRRKRRSWAWRIANPVPFTRPALESMATLELEEAADNLGTVLTEERGMRAIAYAHAGITGIGTVLVAFFVTLAGPAYLTSFLGGKQWGGSVGPDPLVFWLTLTVSLVAIGGAGAHRTTVLMKHARGYQDRLRSVERALWDAKALLRQRREEV